ncbi:MAG: DUF971 domain-containing protein [Candidatus Marinimicrobia bacterium]|nr:DUF971 domain-containing protein [Candidatus Neomarinimicrobiota bacterium]
MNIKNFEIVNDLLLLNWSDNSDSMIDLKQLRDNCPCANCAGEKDALGNLYIGPEQLKTDNSYIVRKLEPVGYYALRPYWADGHKTGLYSFELLKKLSNT